MIAISVEHT